MRSICVLRARFTLIVVSGLTFLAPAVSAQDVPTAAGQVPRFEPAPCPKLPGADELAKASCGYLVVLENRSPPTGRTIRLLVAKYPARSAEKRADPVVYLAGGPGDIAPLEVNEFIAADFIRDRDILVVSQRGTMFSEPALTCAPIDDFAREPTPFLETGGTRAPASKTSSTPVRRKRPATPPIRISKQPSPDWSINSRPSR